MLRWLVVLLFLVPFAPVAGAEGESVYVLELAGEVYEISPIAEARDVEDFYGYDRTLFDSSDNPLQLNKAVTWFLHEGPSGVSLGVIADNYASNTPGPLEGHYTTEWSGIGAGDWVVKDDPFDTFSADGFSLRWRTCCTDGAAYRGGLEAMDVTVNSTSLSGLFSFRFAHADGVIAIPLAGHDFRIYKQSVATVPDAPEVVASVSKGDIEVSWTTPNDGGAPILGYHVYQDFGEGPVHLATVSESPFVVPFVEDTKPAASTLLVSAFNEVGEGEAGSSDCVVGHPGKGHDARLCGGEKPGNGPPDHAANP